MTNALRTVRVGALAVAMMSMTPPAHGFGEMGHRVTGYVARALLSPTAKAALVKLMGSDDVATFTLHMDHHKDRLEERIPGSRDWHYDDIPVCDKKAKPFSEICPAGNCASTQIRRHYGILIDDHSSKGSKQFAVFVLTHLIGDIHQPLHAADNEDRGGNAIKVSLPWTPVRNWNLHGAWDTDILKRMFENQDERKIASLLITTHKDKIEGWQKNWVREWVTESHLLARSVVYGMLPGFACDTDLPPGRVPLPPSYVSAAEPILSEQLAKAGARMAYVLNRALGD